MAEFGFDTDSSGNCICTAKKWDAKGILAGSLLFAFGNKAHPHSVCTDSHAQAVALADTMLRDQLEQIATGDGALDLQFAAAKICDTLNQINTRIRAISAFLGQGIYLGGVITYIASADFLILPFGGGVVYQWDGQTLYQEKAKNSKDRLLRDALGASSVWQGDYWMGTLPPEAKIFAMTGVLPDISTAATQLAAGSVSGSHTNTTSMLLRRELETTRIPPYAVIEYHL